MLFKSLQYHPKMLIMLLLTMRIHQNTINKHNHKLMKKRSKDCVHQINKSDRSISQAKRYHQEFIMTISTTKSIFLECVLFEFTNNGTPNEDQF